MFKLITGIITGFIVCTIPNASAIYDPDQAGKDVCRNIPGRQFSYEVSPAKETIPGLRWRFTGHRGKCITVRLP